MAEYKVQIWRRTEPRVGDRTQIKNLERDEVALEAPDHDSALNQVFRAECAEHDKRVRIYVMTRTPERCLYGLGDFTLGDYVLMELATKKSRTSESGEIEK